MEADDEFAACPAMHLRFFPGLPVVVEASAVRLSSDAGLLPVRQFDERIGLTSSRHSTRRPAGSPSCSIGTPHSVALHSSARVEYSDPMRPIVLALLSVSAGGCGGPVAGPAPTVQGRVYVLRGQGFVFSGGLGTVAQRLQQSGVRTSDLSDWGAGGAVNEIVADRKQGTFRGPLVFVGHSRGGRQALGAAAALAQHGITVDLVVVVDAMAVPQVPGNVRRAVNLYLTQGRVYPAAPLQPTPGAATTIENIALDVAGSPIDAGGANHLSVDDNPQLQDYVFRRVRSVFR